MNSEKSYIIEHEKKHDDARQVRAMRDIPRPETAAGILSAVAACGLYRTFLGKSFGNNQTTQKDDK